LLAVLATATISSAHVPASAEASLVTLYVALATVLVWVPVVLTVVCGARAAVWIASALDWCVAHRTTVTFLPLVVLGTYFMVLGLVHLVQASVDTFGAANRQAMDEHLERERWVGAPAATGRIRCAQRARLRRGSTRSRGAPVAAQVSPST
jgi:hypothetical protein